MARLTFLVPREEMIYLAHNILQEQSQSDQDVEMKVIQTEHAVAEARSAIAGGTSIIIARGLQASLIKQYTDVPVVEIAATAQEMALLIMKAKQIVKKEKPIIAAVGFQNMFCDMTYFNAIYDIRLRTYFAGSAAELKTRAELALEEGADLLIGGDTVVATAQEAGIPSLFLATTEDSLRTAFAMAERISYAIGAEKRSHAQIEALLDYSFNGVVNLDREGIVTKVNPVMRELLGPERERPEGKPVRAVFRDMDEEQLAQVLSGQLESYSSFLTLGADTVFATLAPVLVSGEAEGAILTCHKVKRERPQRRETKPADSRLRDPGLSAPGMLGDLTAESEAMKQCLRLARFYAQARQPVLIFGEEGTERRLLAEGIHNGGPSAGTPFGAFSCAGGSGREQAGQLFGEKGLAVMAEGGALYLEEIQLLEPFCQYQLVQLLRRRMAGQDAAGARLFHLRLFAATSCRPGQLRRLAEQGRFRKDLYYLLSGLTLTVPPLRQRPEDLSLLLTRLFGEICEQYGRYHVLTRGGREYLERLSWPGNLLQLESFLNRLVLTAGKRSIDEVMLRRLKEELDPEAEPLPEEECLCQEAPFLREPVSREEEELRRILILNGGNREKTAQELGISKATLWRRMKKYGIEQ